MAARETLRPLVLHLDAPFAQRTLLGQRHPASDLQIGRELVDDLDRLLAVRFEQPHAPARAFARRQHRHVFRLVRRGCGRIRRRHQREQRRRRHRSPIIRPGRPVAEAQHAAIERIEADLDQVVGQPHRRLGGLGGLQLKRLKSRRTVFDLDSQRHRTGRRVRRGNCDDGLAVLEGRGRNAVHVRPRAVTPRKTGSSATATDHRPSCRRLSRASNPWNTAAT